MHLDSLKTRILIPSLPPPPSLPFVPFSSSPLPHLILHFLLLLTLVPCLGKKFTITIVLTKFLTCYGKLPIKIFPLVTVSHLFLLTPPFVHGVLTFITPSHISFIPAPSHLTSGTFPPPSPTSFYPTHLHFPYIHPLITLLLLNKWVVLSNLLFSGSFGLHTHQSHLALPPLLLLQNLLPPSLNSSSLINPLLLPFLGPLYLKSIDSPLPCLLHNNYNSSFFHIVILILS